MELLENLKVYEMDEYKRKFTIKRVKGWENNFNTYVRKQRFYNWEGIKVFNKTRKKLKLNRTKAKSRLKVIARTIKGFENE